MYFGDTDSVFSPKWSVALFLDLYLKQSYLISFNFILLISEFKRPDTFEMNYWDCKKIWDSKGEYLSWLSLNLRSRPATYIANDEGREERRKGCM